MVQNDGVCVLILRDVSKQQIIGLNVYHSNFYKIDYKYYMNNSMQIAKWWDEFYLTTPPEKIEWYCTYFDLDYEKYLITHNINSGKVIDIGTGFGHQAIQLTKRGFNVLGTDISKESVQRARKIARQEKTRLRIIVDDFFNTTLNEKFDYAFDRGCFHLTKHQGFNASDYITSLRKILKPGGLLFLKTLRPDPMNKRLALSKQEIEEIFCEFIILEINETVFQRELVNECALAWFVIIENGCNKT